MTMIRGVFILVFCISVGLAKAPSKIHGGKRANIYNFPHVVSIHVKTYHICGGSILSRLFILSTASCVLLQKFVVHGNIEIVSGTNDHTGHARDGGEIHQVSYVMFHEDYEPENFWIHDIAVLKLESPLDTTPFRQPANFPDTSRRPNGLQLAGWGSLTGNNRHLHSICIVSLNVLSCMEHFHEHHLNQFCAMPVPSSNIRMITQGDGGSSITTRADRIIIGIVSVISLPFSEKPAIATFLFPYVPYVRNFMQRF